MHARLVLTGRTGLPPEAEWDRYLSEHAPNDLMAQQIRRVKKVRGLGAEVLVARADVADQDQMQDVFATAERHFGPINGVIHAAGVVTGSGFRPISETDEEVCRLQFAPKIRGLCVLDELVQGRALDFCMLVSSLSAVLGGLRMAAYASGNAFMDAFACWRNRTSAYPWLTVNWDSWQRREDEARVRSDEETTGGFIMTAAEGIEAFRRLMSVDVGPQVVVSTGDLQGRIDQWISLDALRDQAGETDADAATRHPRPNLQTEYLAPSDELEQAIARIWGELLGMDRVGVADSFFELGGDSFLGIQVIARLKKRLGVSVSAVSLYEGPTVAALATVVRASEAQQVPAFDQSRSRGEKRRERKVQRQLQETG